MDNNKIDNEITYIPSCWSVDTEEWITERSEFVAPHTGYCEIEYIGKGGSSNKEPDNE